MALITVVARGRSRSPIPGYWNDASIVYRLRWFSYKPEGLSNLDDFTSTLTGGFVLGTWVLPSPTPPSPRRRT